MDSRDRDGMPIIERCRGWPDCCVDSGRRRRQRDDGDDGGRDSIDRHCGPTEQRSDRLDIRDSVRVDWFRCCRLQPRRPGRRQRGEQLDVVVRHEHDGEARRMDRRRARRCDDYIRRCWQRGGSVLVR